MENRSNNQNLAGTVSQKIIGNTIFNYLGNIWQILVSFFLTPYIFRSLDIERFGIWAVMFAVTSYFSLLDLGVGGSFTKFIAGYKARDDRENINNVISHGFLFYVPLGAVQFIIGFFIIGYLPGFLNISKELHSEAVMVFLLGLVAFTIQNIAIPLRSLFEGFQKMGVLNWTRVVSSLPRIAGTVFFIEMGYGIKGLALNEIILALITNLLSLYYSYRIFPQMKIFPRSIHKETFKKIFSFGYKIQVTKIAYLINFQTDKFLIGYFLNTVMVGFYDLGFRVASIARSFPVLMVSAITPAASEIDSVGSPEIVWKLYMRASRYLLLFTAPLFTFMFFNSSAIIELWIGGKYPLAVIVLKVLCIGYFFNLISGVANVIAIGIGKPEFEMETSIYSSIVNIALSIVLIIKYGLPGCVTATAVSFFFYSAYLIYRFHRHFKKPLSHFIRLMTFPVFASLISALVNLGFLYMFGKQSYLQQILVFLGGFIVFAVSYCALLYFQGFPGDDERDIIRGFINSINDKRIKKA